MKVNKNIILLSQMLGSASMALANSGGGQDLNSLNDDHTNHGPYAVPATMGAICILFGCVAVLCPSTLYCSNVRPRNRVNRVDIDMGENMAPVVSRDNYNNNDYSDSDDEGLPPPRYSVQDPALSRGGLNLVQTSSL